MSSYWPSVLWFAAIVVLIPAALWLLKRTPIGGAGGTGLLRNVATLPLSASQRVAIVEVGSGATRQWLVLGVSAQSINALHAMAPLDDATPRGGETSAPFAQLLSRLRRGE